MLPNPAAYDTYGGDKNDYAPAEDVTTDRSAEEANEAFADCAAMTRMIPRAYVAFRTDGGVPECVVVEHDAVWGNGDLVKPAVTYQGDGDYLITWPATITDARGRQQSVNFRRATAQVDTLFWLGQAVRRGPNTVQVNVTDIAAAALADSPDQVVVLVW